MTADPLPVLFAGFGYALILGVLTRRVIRRRKHYGSALSGTLESLLNADRRRAVQIIMEERAEARDPEDRDGNLPDLACPSQ